MNTKDQTDNDELPYPAHDAGTGSPYAMSLVAGAVSDRSKADVSVTLTKDKNRFPASNDTPDGVWVDVEELRKLHPRAAWLLDGAGITE